MKHALLVFLISLLAYLTTAGGHLYSPDEEIMFRMTESLFLEGDLSIKPIPEGFATRKGLDGQEYAQYGIGQPILAVPFYAIGRWLAPRADDATWIRLYGIEGESTAGWWGPRATGELLAPRLAISFFNIVASAALAAVLYLLLLEISGQRGAALFAALLYALGSLAWAHSRPFYSETAAVLFMVLAWYFLLRACRGNVAGWSALAGAATGYAALVRMDSVILYPATGLLLLGPVWSAWGEKRTWLHPYITFCLPALACGGLILGLNHLHFGGFLEMGYADQSEGINFATPLLAGLYGFLFSAGKGLFFFSPGLVAGLFGWRELAARGRWLTAATFVAIALPLCFMAKWQNWAGGWTWGPRHIFMIHPFLAIPAAMWLAGGWNGARRGIAASLLLVGAAVQVFGSSQNFILYYQIYFRNTNGRYYRETYDVFDQAYWGKYYELHFKPSGEGEPYEVPLTFVPAPIQHSLYIPQYSAWSAYPEMFRDYGTFDNLWWRVARPEPPEGAAADDAESPTEAPLTAPTPSD